MITENDRKLIQKFLDKELSAEEKKLFEQKYNSDKEFAKEVRIYTDGVIAIKAASELQKEKYLEQSGQRIIRLKHSKYLLAACIILLIGITALICYFTLPAKIDHQEVYAEYFSLPEDLLVEDDKGNLLLVDRYHSLDKKTDNNLISFTPQDLPDIKNDYKQLFLAGIYFMHEKDFTYAEQAFQSIINNNNNPYIFESEWYLGLIYLKTCRLNKASEKFHELSKSSNYYRKDALEILRKIEKVDSCG